MRLKTQLKEYRVILSTEECSEIYQTSSGIGVQLNVDHSTNCTLLDVRTETVCILLRLGLSA